MIKVLPAERDHVKRIISRMRVEEGVEKVGLDKYEIVSDAVRHSDYSFCAMVDNEVACMWGIHQNTILSDTAYMWLITTPLVEKHQFIFARRSQMYLQGLKKHFNTIQGHVDARFTRSIRWLNWLGFKIHPMFEDGTYRRPFELRQN